MRWIIQGFLCLTLGLAGCAIEPDTPPTAEPEVRPPFSPGPNSGELFEGQIRIHTRGMQGDALGSDLAPLNDLIAFSWNDHQEQPKIYVLPTAGGPPRQVTFGDWPDIHPEFTPTADPEKYSIAYASRREGNFDIYLVSLSGTGGGAWQLTDTPADELHPSFSPDGRYLLFARLDRDGVWKIWRKDLTTQQESYLGTGTNPEWSPTGELIGFQLPSGRDQKLWSLWFMRADGSARTQIVASDAYAAVHPSWSPDGRYLVHTRIPVDKGSPGESASGDVWVVDVTTGATFKVTTTASLDTDACWALDGWIFFSSTRTTGTFNLLSGRIAEDMLKAFTEKPLLPKEPAGPRQGGAR